jgi:hypothetical protein
MSDHFKINSTKVTLKDARSLPTPPGAEIGVVIGLEQPPPKRAAPEDWSRRIVTVDFDGEIVCTPATNLTIVT